MLICVLVAGTRVAMADANQRLTLLDRFREFGFLWSLFVALVGAPSIISLYQSAFVGHDLSALPQSFIEGYEEALAIFGRAVEPALQPLLAWVSDLLGLEMTLHAHWRSLFVLASIVALSDVRARGIEIGWGSGLYHGLFLMVGGLAGSLAAGSVPLDGGWWAQGLIAGLFAAFFTLQLLLDIVGISHGLSFGDAYLAEILKKDWENRAKRFRETAGRFGIGPAIALWVVVYAWLVAVMSFGAGLTFFAAGAALSFVPGLALGAGFAALAGYIFLFALAFVCRSGGSRRIDRAMGRSGFIMLGGFLGAGLVYVADWAIMNWG